MDWSMAGPLIGGGVSTVGGLLSSIFGGGPDADELAKRADEIQRNYLTAGQRDWTQWTGQGMNYLSPYTGMGQWAMTQLMGPGATQGTGQASPQTQSQIDAYNKYQAALKSGEAKPFNFNKHLTDPGNYPKYRKEWIAKNRKWLEPMAPVGTNIEKLGGQWFSNPYPVDQYMNALPESMWKFPSGGGTTAPQYQTAPATGPGSLMGIPAAGKGQNLLGGLIAAKQPGTTAPAPGQPAGGGGMGGILGQMPSPYTPQVSPTAAPGMTPFSMESWANSPWYQFQLDQAKQALERSAIGQGGLYSGQFAQDMNKLSQDYAMSKYLQARQAEEGTQQQAYNQWLASQGLGMAGQQQAYEQWLGGQVNPIMNILGMGQGAAGGSANLLSGLGSGIGQGTMNTGANIAQGYLQAAGQPTTGQQIGGALTGLGGMGLGYGMSQLGTNPYTNLFSNMKKSGTNTSLLTPGSNSYNFLYG